MYYWWYTSQIILTILNEIYPVIGKAVLMGIVSWGPHCGKGLKKRVGYYTRVSYYLDWIYQHWNRSSNETDVDLPVSNSSQVSL